VKGDSFSPFVRKLSAGCEKYTYIRPLGIPSVFVCNHAVLLHALPSTQCGVVWETFANLRCGLGPLWKGWRAESVFACCGGGLGKEDGSFQVLPLMEKVRRVVGLSPFSVRVDATESLCNVERRSTNVERSKCSFKFTMNDIRSSRV
jgi:hypothetical protein